MAVVLAMLLTLAWASDLDVDGQVSAQERPFSVNQLGSNRSVLSHPVFGWEVFGLEGSPY